MDYRVVFLYCIFCFIVAAIAHFSIKTFWLYIVASSVIPAILIIAADAVISEGFDTWSSVAFVVALFIAFICAAFYYLFRLAIGKK